LLRQLAWPSSKPGRQGRFAWLAPLRGIDAFARGDIQALRVEFFAPDIVWHFPGCSQHAGHHQGADQVVAFLTKLQILSGGIHSGTYAFDEFWE
jgi:hypothetical protein